MSNPPVRSKNFAYENESSKLQRERVWFLTRRSKHAACLPLSPSIKHTQRALNCSAGVWKAQSVRQIREDEKCHQANGTFVFVCLSGVLRPGPTAAKSPAGTVGEHSRGRPVARVGAAEKGSPGSYSPDSRDPRGLKSWGKGTFLWNQRLWDPKEKPQWLSSPLCSPVHHPRTQDTEDSRGQESPAFRPGEPKRCPRKPRNTGQSMEREGIGKMTLETWLWFLGSPSRGGSLSSHQTKASESKPLDGTQVRGCE